MEISDTKIRQSESLRNHETKSYMIGGDLRYSILGHIREICLTDKELLQSILKQSVLYKHFETECFKTNILKQSVFRQTFLNRVFLDKHFETEYF